MKERNYGPGKKDNCPSYHDWFWIHFFNGCTNPKLIIVINLSPTLKMFNYGPVLYIILYNYSLFIKTDLRKF